MAIAWSLPRTCPLEFTDPRSLVFPLCSLYSQQLRQKYLAPKLIYEWWLVSMWSLYVYHLSNHREWVGLITQWYSICLVCVKPYVKYSASEKINKWIHEQIIIYKAVKFLFAVDPESFDRVEKGWGSWSVSHFCFHFYGSEVWGKRKPSICYS